jgi:hypothetical protein
MEGKGATNLLIMKLRNGDEKINGMRPRSTAGQLAPGQTRCGIDKAKNRALRVILE